MAGKHIGARHKMETHGPVSVIIPCYRCVDTIARAVHSVRAQTLTPYEVILVDDCSGDGTLSLLKSMQVQYGGNWIKIIELKINSGPSTARNKGWEASSQPYIAFLDADDAWHPQKIEIQLTWMLQHPSIILTGHSVKVLSCFEEFDNLTRFKITNHNFDKIKFKQLLLSNLFPEQSVIIRRDAAFRFPEGQKYAEGYRLWFDLYKAGCRGFRSNEKMVYLFKPQFGAGGLSKNLWEMEKCELLNYKTLFDSQSINRMTLIMLYVYSILKFIRRFFISGYYYFYYTKN